MTTPIVLKFGGTSVRDAVAMRRVVSIVERERASHPVVVTSACAGVTDLLLDCARLSGERKLDEALGIAGELRDRHLAILRELDPECRSECRSDLCRLLDEIEQLVHGVILLGELTPRTLDAFASYGERLSSVLLTEAFGSAGWRAGLIDSRRFIITDDHFTSARPLMQEIDRRAQAEVLPMLDGCEVVVAQGFIGSTLDGVTTTIGRGGSDHTGALLGAVLGAREIQIWTDVSGILTADPRLVPAAHIVPEVTFTEARELAYFGAKVIHPDTILPAVSRAIPVVIRNSMRPDDAGTRILPDGSPVPAGIHSITMKRGMMALVLSPREQFAELQVEESLALFAKHSAPIQCAIVAESRAMVVIAASAFNDILLAALEASCRIEVADDLALLCMTGASLRSAPAVLATPLAALDGVPISFIAAGSSDHTVLLGVHQAQAIDALKMVHRSLFE
jgi:aspartate kinase